MTCDIVTIVLRDKSALALLPGFYPLLFIDEPRTEDYRLGWDLASLDRDEWAIVHKTVPAVHCRCCELDCVL